ncbi:MAG: FHA domain-containing protein [Coriobacteriales bacterium]|nr:FHA domain-containing protein [Coriobacteriales bacterium]
MDEWYHSGIEGYCKAAADLLGDRKDGDSVLGLCRDMFPDRVAGTSLSHIWTASSLRNGDRKCRQRVFEMLWLNEVGVEVYRAEAELFARGECPESGFRTIDEASSYAESLRSCKDEKERSKVATKQFESKAVRARVYIEEADGFSMNEELEDENQGYVGEYSTIPSHSAYRDRLKGCRSKNELEQTALDQCEGDAIERCVQRVVDLYENDEAANVSYLALLVGIEDFPVRFFTSVVPAIESGLRSERHRPSDIQRYIQTLNGLIYMAHRRLSDGDLNSVDHPFREFATALFAGLVFGPNDRLALGLNEDTTQTETDSGFGGAGFDGYDGRESAIIRLTQVFDARGAHTGYSELFRPSQVVFFGRSPEIDKYLARCRELFADDSETIATVDDREPVVFPTVLHPAVGRWHGMLLCEDDTWRYYDLASTNGSSIVTADGITPVQTLIELRPGDYLRVGASANVDVLDTNAYEDAATLFVSSHVDLTEDYV